MFHSVLILLYLLTQMMDTAYEVNGMKCDRVNHTAIGHLIVIGQWGYIYHLKSVCSRNILIMPPDGSLMFPSFSFTLSSTTVYSEKLRWLLFCNDVLLMW